MSGWDSDRVRIELCAVMTFGTEGDERGSMRSRHGADIWLSDDEGKIRKTRKPAVTLVDESRPALLRQLAAWIESRGDDSLSLMALEVGNRKLAQS